MVKKWKWNILKDKSKITIGQYFNYENILLRTYIEIANGGDFKKLLVSGEFEIEQAVKVWESIVNRNDSGAASKYNKVFKAHKSYTDLYHTYVYIKACFLKLYFQAVMRFEPIEDELIIFLEQEGYKIDKGDYHNSIITGLNKSNNFVSRLTAKENELDKLTGNNGKVIKSKKPVTFEELMASITIDLGFVVSDDITLSRYNEYCKVINAKRKAEEKAASNGRRRNTKR